MSEKEFQIIYNQHYQKVYRLCMGYFKGNDRIAEDVTQEVFIKVWEKSNVFRGDSHISTWIYRITVNTCLMYLRSRKLKKEISSEKFPEKPENNPDHQSDKEQQLKLLYDCIYKLDELNKIIILMVLEGLSYDKIAAVAGVSEETLRVRIHRIKKSLTKCVNDE
ncbi:sigma-70 family RNA polymerase sigma factor [Flavobacteriaceae bacterium R38]|nr:sigma-70 family RNA polymerase sigma factor [Flavobacteriaceae bacterium R38]